MYSKRDVTKAKPQRKRATSTPREEQAGPSTRWKETEESSEDETYVVSEETKDEESTPTDTTITENVDDTAESENEREPRPRTTETEAEETANPQEMPTHQERANPVKDNFPGKGKKKAVKASVVWSPPQRKSSRRRPTKRYGIDVVMKVDEEDKNKRYKEFDVKNIWNRRNIKHCNYIYTLPHYYIILQSCNVK